MSITFPTRTRLSRWESCKNIHPAQSFYGHIYTPAPVCNMIINTLSLYISIWDANENNSFGASLEWFPEELQFLAVLGATA